MRKLRAETTLRKHGGKKAGGSESRVPSDVRDYLGAEAGDRLIFEDGCAESVERAALRGRYVVLRVAARPGEAVPCGPPAKVLKPHAPPPAPPAASEPVEVVPPPLEPFGAFVDKFRRGRRR